MSRKIMLQKKMFKHQFQGCLAESKWMGARKAQNWDAMVLYAPKMAKKMREVPNVLREVLGMDKKKYSRSKFPQASKLRNLPTALMLAAEDLLIQRMELGEVVNYQYVSGIVDLLSETWNQKVAELKEEVRRLTAPSILEAEDAVWDEAEDPAQAVRSALSEMEPIERSCHLEACRTPRTQFHCIHTSAHFIFHVIGAVCFVAACGSVCSQELLPSTLRQDGHKGQQSGSAGQAPPIRRCQHGASEGLCQNGSSALGSSREVDLQL